VEGSHVTIGVDIAKKFKESEDVIHAIHAHHGMSSRIQSSLVLYKAADAISAARPGARRENIENYVKRLEKLEKSQEASPGLTAAMPYRQAVEIRVMVKPETVGEDEMILLAREIAKKIEDELTYPGQIKVHLLRETKAVDYAK
jgi:ribonuclease Y